MSYNDYNGLRISPKVDRDANTYIFDTSTSYGKLSTFKRDSINDLKRWMSGFDNMINTYSVQKFLYEKEKKLKIESKEERSKMKSLVSENKMYLEDMRKAFDWFENTFDSIPEYQSFKKDFNLQLKRLKKLKKYLGYRVRSLAGRGMYNEPSKNLLKFVKIKINAINILFDKRYNKRRNILEIYQNEINKDKDNYDLNGNNFFTYD